jgi:nicotinamidase-related amidase
VQEIASLVPEVAPIDKLEFSCFGKDTFCSAVKALPGNRTTMLVCGMEAHICVAQTAFAAVENGYLVHVASDAVGSRHEWNWQVGLDRMQNSGCIISSTEMMIYELLRKSGTPQFKELLKYIK